MLQKFRDTKGQMVASEYVIVLALAAAAITAMGVYFRRAVQARIRDANVEMIDIVRQRTNGTYQGTNVWVQYEPYYTNTESTITRDLTTTREKFGVGPGFGVGISQTTYNQQTLQQTFTNTLSPLEGN